MNNISVIYFTILMTIALLCSCSDTTLYNTHKNKAKYKYEEIIKIAISKTIWENINIADCYLDHPGDTAYIPCIYNTFSYTEPSWVFAAYSFRDISGPITIRMKYEVDTTEYITTIFKGRRINIPFMRENYSIRYTPPFFTEDKKYIGGLIINSLGEILAYGIEFKDGEYHLKYIFQITS